MQPKITRRRVPYVLSKYQSTNKKDVVPSNNLRLLGSFFGEHIRPNECHGLIMLGEEKDLDSATVRFVMSGEGKDKDSATVCFIKLGEEKDQHMAIFGFVKTGKENSATVCFVKFGEGKNQESTTGNEINLEIYG